MSLLQCFNKGCGEKFKQESNEEGCCTYHPGVPVFHDALKGWSCCEKRSTDFTQFLNFPGCTTGKHSNEKPKEPEKPQKIENEELLKEKVIEVRQPQPKTRSADERPSQYDPMQRLKVTVGASLKQALEKQMKELEISKATDETTSTENGIKTGETCKNNACKACYQGEQSNEETCTFHPGVPIFHEGLKYWSCCRRKTTEFDNFLDQAGCETGKHVWIKKELPGEKKSCRFDWHQTGPFITLSVFSKVADPDKTVIEANKIMVNINIVFEGGKSLFEKNVHLKEEIIPEESNVKMLGTKVEINLKKAEPFSWSDLEYKPPVEES
ncbi:CHORDC1 [Mytilus coruscus]|uniref:CHORDC1 n=1 Tax=Mytilus coruscus TaxID=42192 RepID=A0A6J8CI38_MYTCO|nr:CHORDC1 [Mytilus coruscus]